MRILLLGDAGHYHASLAGGLRRLGHEVTLASDGGRWMHTRSDIDISRRKGKIGGAWLWLKLNTTLASDLKGYDIVQLCSPFFLELRPERLLTIFNRLKADNGRVFLTDLGNSPAYVRMCLAPDSPLKYSEWRNPSIINAAGNPAAQAWLSTQLDTYCSEIYNGVYGVMTALYEYHIAALSHLPAHKVHYTGIPIDLKSLPAPKQASGEKVRILSAFDRSRAEHKGALILHNVAQRIAAAHPDRAELRQVCNLPFAQFLDELARADIVLDQLYSYTPATTALLSMALDAVPVSGGEDDYYSFISEPSLRPVVNAHPTNLSDTAAEIERLILDPSLLKEKKNQGREFIELYHSADALALQYLDIWTGY